MHLYWSNWYVLFPFAISMFVAMRLSDASTDSVHRTLLGAIVRAVTVLLFWFAFLAIGFRSELGVIWLAIVIVLGLMLWRKRRRLERNVVFHSAVGTEGAENRSLLLSFFADESIGQLPRLSRRIERHSLAGVSWGRALELSRVGRSAAEVLVLRLLDRYGNRAVEAADREDAESISPLRLESEVERIVGRFAVFGWVFSALPIIAMVFTFIVPTFKEMFEEFGLEPPPVFSFLLNEGSVLVISLIAVTMLALLLLAATVVLIWLFPSVLETFPFRLLAGDYFRCVGLSALARTSQEEKDLPSAFAATAEVLPLPFMASRYGAAAELLSGGADLPDALRKSRLISNRQRQQFGVTIDGPDAIWALRQYAVWRVDRMMRRYNLVVQIIFIAITFVLGAVVATVSYGFIQLLAQMIIEIA